MRFLLILLVLFGLNASAEDLYFTQSGSGSQNGTIGNPWSLSNANNASNWGVGAGKVSPGDTLHVVGTITGAFTFQSGGTAGNIITLIFDAGAKFSAAHWGTDTGAINSTNQSYITIDGGASGMIGGYGVAGSVNGIIECTANGEGLGNQVDTCGVRLIEPKNVTVQNLALYNIFVRPAAQAGGSGFGMAVKVTDTTGNGVTNFTATNLLIHDAYCGVFTDYGIGDSNYIFSYITAYNCNWGGVCGDRGAGATMTGLVVHHNYFYNWTNWNDTSGNAYHHNGFYAWADSGGVMTNPTFYDNVCGPGFGNSYQTSGMWNSGDMDGCTYYNNLFICGPGEFASSGMIGARANTSGSTMRVYSNTFIGGSAGGFAINVNGAGNPTNLDIKNNMLINGAGGSLADNGFIAIFSNTNITVSSDYNLLYGVGSVNSPWIYSSTTSGVYLNQSAWNLLGYDLNSFGANTSDPNLSPSYRPQVPSVAIGNGVNLSIYFTTDLAGIARAVPWDIGAYAYFAGPTSPTSSLTGKSILKGKSTLK